MSMFGAKLLCHLPACLEFTRSSSHPVFLQIQSQMFITLNIINKTRRFFGTLLSSHTVNDQTDTGLFCLSLVVELYISGGFFNFLVLILIKC